MNPAKASYTTRTIRSMLQTTCKTDDEFNCFCMDYYRQVYDLFAMGMSRLQKVNLLLEHIEDLITLAESIEQFKRKQTYDKSPLLRTFRAQILVGGAMMLSLSLSCYVYYRYYSVRYENRKTNEQPYIFSQTSDLPRTVTPPIQIACEKVADNKRPEVRIKQRKSEVHTETHIIGSYNNIVSGAGSNIQIGNIQNR